MRILTAALFALVMPSFAVIAAEPENPYKIAKVGDKLTYKMSAKFQAANIEGTMTQTIVEKTDKELSMKCVAKTLGKETAAVTEKIDLTKEFDPNLRNDPISRIGIGDKAEKQKTGTEKLKLGDKEFECTWTTYKVTPKEENPKGITGEAELKVWICKDVPGPMKVTTSTKVMKIESLIVMELIEFTNAK